MKTFTREQWSEIRARGHTRFILRGFVHSGLPFALVMVAGEFVWAAFEHSTPLLNHVIITFAAFLLAIGYMPAELQWRRCEREFNDHAA